MALDITKTIGFYCERVNQTLINILARHDTNASSAFLRLLESMRYMLVSSSAKRLRPILVYALGEAMHAPLPLLDIPAAAIELIHTASLIHDDLPALDNDQFRREKLTCHKAFDEATAILAGNSMQMLAAEILSSPANKLKGSQKLQCIQVITVNSGINGIMEGQMLDLYEVKPTSPLKTLESTYRLKTACLIKAALFLGAIVANCQDQLVFDALTQFSEKIGLAYQIQDDILDVEVDQRSHSKQNSVTYPSIVGIEESKAKVKSLYGSALALLQVLPCDIKLLEAITKRMIFRAY